MFEIDTAADFVDLLARLDTFLTNTGSAFGLTYAGTGDGILTDYRGASNTVAETFTITATSATTFDVVGSVGGSLGTATVGTPFSESHIAFLISAGSTPFVAGDMFILSTAPKWTTQRRITGCTVLATQGNTGLYGAQNLVDGKNAVDENRIWRVDSPVTLPQDVEFTFRTARTIGEYQLALFSDPVGGYFYYPPTAWTFDYWNGSSWVTLDTQSGITSWGASELKSFTISSPASATLYRLHITAIKDATRLILGAVRLIQETGPALTRGDQAFAQYIWQAPGNDGTSQIYAGVHLFERADADYFNWEVASLDGYNSSSRFYNQPGIERKGYLPLWNASIPYWFIANGRSAIILAKVNAQYEVAILGEGFDPYFSPGQWPYPVGLGCSLAFGDSLPTWESSSWRWSNSSNSHRLPTHSDSLGDSDPVPATRYQLRARNLDGSWSGYEATVNDSPASTPGPTRHLVWPFRCGVSLYDVDLDGSYTLWPIMLCHAAPNILGQLSGIAAVAGQGLSAETLIRKGVVDWIVIPNITRTDRDDFVAVALD